MLLPLAFAQNATRIRYMPLGDSITEYGCWRAQLLDKLTKANYAVDFVGGSNSTTVCEVGPYDNNHEGHSGYRATNIAGQNQLVGWLQRNPADVITMHLGTVDIVQASIPTAQIIAAFTVLVRQMRESNPRMKIIVSDTRPVRRTKALIPRHRSRKSSPGRAATSRWLHLTKPSRLGLSLKIRPNPPYGSSINTLDSPPTTSLMVCIQVPREIQRLPTNGYPLLFTQ
jgi:hypothetical protein